MQHLFSLQGMAQMAALLSKRPLLALDFDGTLAPIVSHPSEASIADGAALHLAKLAHLLPVAIVTGRSVDDVRERLGFEPTYIVGSHGAEGLGGSGSLEGLRSAYAWLEANRVALERLDVEIEDKRYSIALHYRRAVNPANAARSLGLMLSQLGSSVRVFGGKMVFNIVPASAPDKADAVLELVRRENATGAVFVGDDLNDEPVFQAAPAHWVTVKIGLPTPLPTFRSAARFHLLNCDEVVTMLERMVEVLGGEVDD